MSRVGQLLGRLFAGGEERAAALRAYGKLPFYAEYRRLELSAGAATLFSQWLDQGRLAWARSASRSPAGTVRPSRLLLRLAGARELVVASVWDSRDSLGRVFPFVFFVVAQPEWLGAGPFERCAAAFAIQLGFEGCYRELARLGRGGDFYRLYRKRSIALQPDDLPQHVKRMRQQAAALRAAQWLAAALPDADAGAWFAGLQQRARRWRAQPALRKELALRVPLAGGHERELQAAIWFAWIAELNGRSGELPGLVMPPATDAGRQTFYLLVRDPLPDDFQLLTSDADRYDYVEDLASMAREAPAAAAPAARAPAEPLLEWLARHGR